MENSQIRNTQNELRWKDRLRMEVQVPGRLLALCLPLLRNEAATQTSAKTPFAKAQESSGAAQAAVTESAPKVVEPPAQALEPAVMQAAAEAKAPAESELAKHAEQFGGCFLVYSEENQGTLRNQWSETEVEGALAVLRPGKPVPKHKYTHNQGRSDILKQANLGVHKQRHCKGFAQFLKSGRNFEARFVVRSEEVKVVLALKDEGVLEVSDPGPRGGRKEWRRSRSPKRRNMGPSGFAGVSMDLAWGHLGAGPGSQKC